MCWASFNNKCIVIIIFLFEIYDVVQNGNVRLAVCLSSELYTCIIIKFGSILKPYVSMLKSLHRIVIGLSSKTLISYNKMVTSMSIRTSFFKQMSQFYEANSSIYMFTIKHKTLLYFYFRLYNKQLYLILMTESSS
jgi:hypothetical protein